MRHYCAITEVHKLFEIVENITLEQKARHLTSKLDENNDLIDRLRRERTMLADMHAGLQKQFATTSEVKPLKKCRIITNQ